MRIIDSSNYSITQKAFLSHKDNGELKSSVKLVEKGSKVMWIMDTVVTQAQWKLIMGTNPSLSYLGDNRPVINVSRLDIDNFIKALRKRTGLMLDLPTREEWQIAAEASTTYLQTTPEKDALWFYKDESIGTSPVRHLKARQINEYDIYDMLGNVWEWTKDEDDNRKGEYHFLGGSWQHGVKYCTSDIVKPAAPNLKSEDIGFRLVWRFDISNLNEKKRAGIGSLVEKLVTMPYSTPQDIVEKVLEIGEDYRKEQIVKLLSNVAIVEEGFYVRGAEVDSDETSLSEHAKSLPKSWRDKAVTAGEVPHHFVRVKGFYMLKTPVVQKLWNLVMRGSSFTNPAASNIGDKFPQTNVSWRMIDEFLKRIKEDLGITFRLPSSAEWEYAARGGHEHPVNKELKRIFEKKELSVQQKHEQIYKMLALSEPYFKYSGSNSEKELGIIPRVESYEVGQYKANELGIYDLSGCVGEWCADISQEDFYQICLESEEYKTHGYFNAQTCTGKEGHRDRVWRGGGWKAAHIDETDAKEQLHAEDCRTTYYFDAAERDVDDDLGFRIVIDPDEYKKLKSLQNKYGGNKS